MTRECQKEPTFGCNYCSYKAFQKIHVLSHIKTRHRGDKTSPYECTTCGKHYKAKSTLWRHSTGECQKEPRYACQYCSYRSFQEIHLISHIKNQHLPADDSNKPSCSICHKIFNTRSAKCLHEKYRCQKSPMFSCQYCPLKFYLKSCWVRHTNRQHGISRANILS
ncbi:zinc finger X-chromosomal protein-like [Rhynchophorus ferrugineus]|uniref:zinc finger X-chromosomal protein-like n=1 Tax=Rhynchophorus ferrugineus TaxID=354439 RepID=UPI003FCE118B